MKKQNKLAFGFWNYTSTGHYGVDEPKEWKNFGATITMSHYFDAKKDSKEDFLTFLDVCNENGIKIIINDSRTDWRNHTDNMDGYEEDFKSAVKDFGKHPATFGFSIGDEPREKDFNVCIKGCKLHNKYAKNLTAFVNFYQYNPHTVSTKLDNIDYKTWVNKFIKQGKLKVICYDEYRQLEEGEEGINEWFENLKIYQELAEENNIDFWVTPSVVGHWNRRIPTPSDLEWQLNTAVSSGAKGIMWFYLYEISPDVNFRGTPIDEYGHKRENYYELARLQKNFNNTYKDLFCRAKLLKCCHKKDKYYGYGGFQHFSDMEDEYVENISATYNCPISYSVFEDENKDKYLAFVNLSQEKNDYFTFAFSKKVKKIKQVMYGFSLKNLKDSHQDNKFSKNSNSISFSTWMAPGQMNVYKISL